jgi:hypothetical protein
MSGFVTSSLGFKSAKCAAKPCPCLPLQHVVLCFRVNNNSQILVQQGCLLSTVNTTVEPTTVCNVDWSAGPTYNSEGKKCRIVTFDRMVPCSTFLRLRVCSAVAGCVGCADADVDASGAPITNALLSFQINGVDLTAQLQAILNNPTLYVNGWFNCIHVGPIVAPVGSDTLGSECFPFVDLSDVPQGAEIQVGPIGQSILYATPQAPA